MDATPNPSLHGFRPDPQTRGTMGVVLPCIFTLIICIWKTMFLNIQMHRSSSKQAWRKVIAAAIALLLPEAFIIAAYFQQRESQALRRDVDSILGPKSSHTNSRGRASSQGHWHADHYYYAAMGGFTIDTSTSERPFLPNNRNRLTITLDGLRFIARTDPTLIPTVTAHEIRDKSKVSVLHRSILCLQTVWFCVHMITRWYQGLHVSLLELHTVAHCLCALTATLLWWNKPADISQPTLLHGEMIDQMAAFMVIASHRALAELDGRPVPLVTQAPEDPTDHERRPDEDGSLRLFPGTSAFGFRFDGWRDGSNRSLNLVAEEVRCWQLAAQAVARYHIWDLPHCRFPQAMLVERISNFPEATTSFVFNLIVLATCLLYGGLHLLAWNYSFRSLTEGFFWQLCTIYTASFGALLVSLQLLIIPWPRLLPIFGLLWYICLACRGYIIVESVIHTFYLPESSFRVSSWSSYFPHLG